MKNYWINWTDGGFENGYIGKHNTCCDEYNDGDFNENCTFFNSKDEAEITKFHLELRYPNLIFTVHECIEK